MAAINGFDSVGHYLRAALIVNLCSTYATLGQRRRRVLGEIQSRSGAVGEHVMTAVQALMPGVSLNTRRTGAVLRGMSPAGGHPPDRQ